MEPNKSNIILDRNDLQEEEKKIQLQQLLLSPLS